MISNGKKAVIHVAKAQVGMTEDEYRDLLGSVGVTSSRDLTNKTFGEVMDRFEKLGFKRKTRRRYRRVNNLPRGKAALMGKLEAIILDMGLSWNYVDGITRKRFKNDDGSPIEKAQWLDADDLFKLVQMMVIHQKRQLKKERQQAGQVAGC